MVRPYSVTLACDIRLYGSINALLFEKNIVKLSNFREFVRVLGFMHYKT